MPFIHSDYLDVADAATIVTAADAIRNAGKLVKLGPDGTISPALLPTSGLSVTSVQTSDGVKVQGDITLQGGGSISITRSGSVFTISSSASVPVSSLQAVYGTDAGDQLTGDVYIKSGPGITLASDSNANTLTIKNAGVVDVNGIMGSVTITGNSGIQVSSPDSNTIQLSLGTLSWSSVNNSGTALADSFVVRDHLGFSGSSASIYRDGSYTVIRGDAGVRVDDILKVGSIVIPSGKDNGIFVGSTRITEVSGTAFFTPGSSSVIDFTNPIDPLGTSLTGVKGITPPYVSSGTLALVDPSTNLYTTTFNHGAKLYPLQCTVSRIMNPGTANEYESVSGCGVNLGDGVSSGYSVQYDRNTITVTGRFSPFDSGSKMFRVRSLFASEASPTQLPDPSNIVNAPSNIIVSLIGEPTGGGTPMSVAITSDPVRFADLYIWEQAGTPGQWITNDPVLLSGYISSLGNSLAFPGPGIYNFTSRARNSTGDGPYSPFSVVIRPFEPVISGTPFNYYSPVSGSYSASLNVYYINGNLSILDAVSGSNLAVVPSSGLVPGSGNYVQTSGNVRTVTIGPLMPNTSYSVVAQASSSGGVTSSLSPPVSFVTPP